MHVQARSGPRNRSGSRPLGIRTLKAAQVPCDAQSSMPDMRCRGLPGKRTVSLPPSHPRATIGHGKDPRNQDAYTAGCRCDDCREATRVARARQRANEERGYSIERR